jgi:hypothetical protein
MGVAGAHALTYCLKDISLECLFSMAVFLFNQKVHQSNRRPTLYVDASWIVRSCTCEARTSYLIRLCCMFVAVGFRVVIVCDGPTRHHSKRSTLKRIAETYKSRICLHRNNSFLMSLLASKNSSDSVAERSQLDAAIKVVGQKITTLQNKVRRSEIEVGTNVFTSIQDELSLLNYDNNLLSVVQADFQADSTMAGSLVCNDAEMVLTADSDLAALLGDKCVGVKKFIYVDRAKNKQVKGLEVFSADLKTIQVLCDRFNVPITDLVLAKRPVFEGIGEMRVRCLIAVAIGCDVYLSGVPGITPKVICDFFLFLNKHKIDKSQYYDKLMEKLGLAYRTYSKKKLLIVVSDDDIIQYQSMLSVFVDCLMYEPTNVSSLVEVTCTTNTYIGDKPTSKYHPYITAFARNDCTLISDVSIENASDVGVCVGPGKGRHFFMLKEGYSTCKSCSKVKCLTCNFDGEPDFYCVNCYAGEQFVDIEDIEEDKTSDEMVSILLNRGYSISTSDSVEEIVDMYDLVISKNNGIHNEDIVAKVKFPKEPTNFLLTVNIITSFFLSNGGSFIHDNKLKMDDVIQILDIICELVNIKKTQPGVTQTDIVRTHCVIPTMIVEFAQKARFDSLGYRLLKRCIRHALDSAAVDIREAKIDVCCINGIVNLVLTHKVKASMRNDIYNVTVCFSKNEITACQCDCKCGSQNSERVICIHILPTMYQIALLLFEGLGEHLLIELAAYVGRLNETDVTQEHNDALQKITTSLLFAVTQTVPNIHTEESGLVPLKIMLNQFSVGTEISKTIPPPPVDRLLLKSLRNLDRRSALTKAALIINKPGVNVAVSPILHLDNNSSNSSSVRDSTAEDIIIEEVDSIVDTSHIVEDVVVPADDIVIIGVDSIVDMPMLSTDNYRSIMHSCWDFCRLNKQKSNDNFLLELVGFRVLSHRASDGKSFADIKRNDVSSLTTRNIMSLINHANGDIGEKRKTVLVSSRQDDVDYDKGNVESNVVITIADEFLTQETTADRCCSTKRMTCCACHRSNRNNPTLTFSKVPNTLINITGSSSDDKRFQYQRESMRRKIFLQRLRIHCKNNNSTYLTYCSTHTLQTETFIVEYKNRRGNKVSQTCKLVVPIDVYAPTLQPTRSSRLLVHSPPPKPIRPTFASGSSDSEEEQLLELDFKSPYKKKRQCSYHRCKSMYALDMICIPSFPKHLPKQFYTHNHERLLRASKIVLRNECLRRIGVVSNGSINDKDYRICQKHDVETVTRAVEYYDLKNIKQKAHVEMNVPIAYDKLDVTCGNNNNIVRVLARGASWRNKLDSARRLSRELQIQFGADEDHWESVILSTIKRPLDTSNNFIDNDNNKPNKKLKVLLSKTDSNKNIKSINMKMSNHTDQMIKDMTGFPSLSAMVCFVILINNGEIESIITNTHTSTLTWFEEWLFVLEKIWGRLVIRWCDASNKYGISKRSLLDLFDVKVKQINEFKSRWGVYATYQEDKDLRQSKWETEFGQHRLVMWDNTNIPLCFKPTDAEAQRNTYSQYYSGNVGKGGVFIQPCGWMGTHDLWMGAVSDSEYMLRSGVFEQQHKFLTRNDPLSSHVSWLNMLDRGYRNLGGFAYENGKQTVVQPAFSRADNRFNTYETLRSSSVAAIRGGNERAVKNAKSSKYLSSGLKSNESVIRLCNVWESYGFQLNFMFRPVH